MDELDALDLATEEFRRRLERVTDDDLSLATPCEEWDVRYLTAHVVGGNRFASLVLDGETSAAAIERIMSTTQLGPHPSEDFAESAGEQRLRFRRPGILDRPVDHLIGPIETRRFLGMRIYDTTVHAWDLATAIGADRTLDPDLVDAVLAFVRTEPMGAASGIDATAADGQLQAGPQHQLLRLAGRTPAPASD